MRWLKFLIIANIAVQSFAYLLENLNPFSENLLPNNKCGVQMKSFLNAIKAKELWALKMIDASSKLQTGLVKGNIYNLGNYDECLAIETSTADGLIEGKYCLGSIALHHLDRNFAILLQYFKLLVNQIQTEVNSTYAHAQSAICIPSACTANDINDMLPQYLSNYIRFDDTYCQTLTTGPDVTAGDIIVFTIAAVIILILLFSTVYDIYLYYSKSSPIHPIALSFSLLTNGKGLLSISENPLQLKCLAGIRTISMMWVIFGHSICMAIFRPYSNYTDGLKWAQSTYNMYIVSATLSVDTFFLLSGTLLVYVMFSINKNKNGMFNVPLFYFHRFLRIMPALIAILVVNVTIMKYFGNGPLWPFSTIMKGDCETKWWQVLLFVNNYGGTMTCIPVSWYLSVDTHLYLLSPLILIPLKGHPRKTLGVVAALLLASIASCFWTAWYNEMSILLGPNYMESYYTATHARAAPWLIGLILGYIIYTFRSVGEDLYINKYLVYVIWITVLSIMATCVFAGNHLLLEGNTYRTESIFHIGLVRSTWALTVGWVIFACVFGYGGPINAFLSLNIFQVLARLGYSTYLWHLFILEILSFSAKSVDYGSVYTELYDYCPKFVIITIVAAIWTLTFESPIIALEKIFFGERVKSKKSEEKTEDTFKI